MRTSSYWRMNFVCFAVWGILGSVLLLPTPVSALNFRFFESPQEGGYATWNHSANVSTRNTWLAAAGETPDYYEDFEGTDWRGRPWQNGRVFDSQLTSAVFEGGARFSNVGPDKSSRAYASNGASCALGCARPIGSLSWRGHETNTSTMSFGSNPVDYLGFYIFDTDHPPVTRVTYNIQFTDGTVESIRGSNAYNNRYLFVGFLNTHASASIAKFWIGSHVTSRYGIDNIGWGKIDPKPTPEPTPEPVPEPSSILFVSTGLLCLLRITRRHRKS